MDEEGELISNPIVSVIIPTYNRADFLPGALESVWAQGFDPLEVIIIDDGSTDNTPQLLAALGERVVSIHQENQGTSVAKNRGLQIARADIIAFLDSDDLWPPGRLQLQLPYLLEPFDYDYVMGYTQFVRLPGGRPLLSIHEKPSAAGSMGAGLYKKTVFDRVGCFDPGLRQGEDLDWHQRARSAGLRVTTIPEVTLIYQMHADNLTNNRVEARQGYLQMLRKSIDRNRSVE